MKGRRAACDAAPHDDDLGLDHGASDAGYPAMHVTSPPARLALDMTARDTYGAPYSSGGGRSMIPAAFEYHAPTSIIEASALLARLGEDAKILSGGQSLIPLMKLRLANPHHLVDINGIPGLSFIREAEGFLRIGALTRESDLEESELIRTRYPLIHDTSQVIAARSVTSPPPRSPFRSPSTPTTSARGSASGSPTCA